MSGLIHSGVEDITDVTIQNINTDDTFFENPIKSQALSCDICNIKVTSTKILQRHLEGRKHKLRAERNGKCYHCDVCDVTANSETQLNIHLNSSKHKSKLIKQEYAEFTDLSASRKALWVLIFCIICIFLNLLLLFKVIL